MSVRYITVLVLVSLIGTPSTTHGAVTAWTSVVVRVYDANGVLAGTAPCVVDGVPMSETRTNTVM